MVGTSGTVGGHGGSTSESNSSKASKGAPVKWQEDQGIQEVPEFEA